MTPQLLLSIARSITIRFKGHYFNALIFMVTIGMTAYCCALTWAHAPVSFWDEVHVYLGVGNRPFPQVLFFSVEWSPLYILWYRFLSYFTEIPSDLLYLNQIVLPMLLLATWFFFLLRIGWTIPVAAIAVLCISIHDKTWFSNIKVHHFSLLVSAGLAWVILGIKDRFRQWALSPIAFVPLVLTRPEMLMLFPAGLTAYLFYFFYTRSPPAHLATYLKIFICSFMLLVAMGILSGAKSGETYFKKHLERFQEIGSSQFASEVEVQKVLFPNSDGAFDALFDNPKVFFEHSLFHLKFFSRLLKDFLFRSFNDSPFFMVGVLALALLGLTALIRKGPASVGGQLGVATFLLFLIVWPHFALALIYGTLERYNIASAFVLFSLLSAPLLVFHERQQKIAAAVLLLAFLASTENWRQKIVARTLGDFTIFHNLIGEQFRSLLRSPSPAFLTDCGAIWNVVYPETGRSENFILMARPNRAKFRMDTKENLKRFDVVVFCDLDKNRNVPGLQDHWNALNLPGSGFHRFRLQPANIIAFVRPGDYREPLPNGITREQKDKPSQTDLRMKAREYTHSPDSD